MNGDISKNYVRAAWTENTSKATTDVDMTNIFVVVISTLSSLNNYVQFNRLIERIKQMIYIKFDTHLYCYIIKSSV